MSHAAVYSEVLFWFVVVLTLLLVMFIGVVVRSPPGTVGSLRRPEFNPPAPPPALVRWPEATGLPDAAVRSARTGYQPRHAGTLKPELMAVGRLRVSAGPPWGPAPEPPGLPDRGTVAWLYRVPGQVPGRASVGRELPPGPGLLPRAGSARCAADMTGPGPACLGSAPIAAASTPSGGPAGAHRQARRPGAHRARISTGQARRSAGRTGRHRAEVH